MKTSIKDKKERLGYLDFIFAEVPILGVMSVLLSNDQSKSRKVTAILATLVGVISAVIYNYT